MFDKIVNPETGRRVSVNSAIGKRVLRNYAQMGGAGPSGPFIRPKAPLRRSRGRPRKGMGRVANKSHCVGLSKDVCAKTTGCAYAEGKKRSHCRLKRRSSTGKKRAVSLTKKRRETLAKPAVAAFKYQKTRSARLAEMDSRLRGAAQRAREAQMGGARRRSRGRPVNHQLDGCGWNVTSMRCGQIRNQKKSVRGDPRLNKQRCRKSGRTVGRKTRNYTCVKRPGSPKNPANVARGRNLISLPSRHVCNGRGNCEPADAASYAMWQRRKIGSEGVF